MIRAVIGHCPDTDTAAATDAKFDGPLYQIVRSDKKSINISTLAAGGYANAAAQETFCEAGEEGTHGSVAAWKPGGCCATRLTCLAGMTNASYHPGCVGCATCPDPNPEGPVLGACTITRIFDRQCTSNPRGTFLPLPISHQMAAFLGSKSSFFRGNSP